METISKLGNGFDFSFETAESKVFHCSVPTKLSQLLWVHLLEVRSAAVAVNRISIGSVDWRRVCQYESRKKRWT